MKYMGSKNRIAKKILPLILDGRKPGQWYVEPFVGGANIIDKVSGNRLGSDSNEYAIAALEMIRDRVEDLPKNNKEFTEADYKAAKDLDDKGLKGFVGFTYSYGAKWLGGWSRNRENRDYVRKAYNDALRQHPRLKGIKFVCCKYDELEIPDRSIIYCDPPYENTTEYKDNGFDHEKFWQWCRNKADEGHRVFISEYTAPDDIECIWEKELVSGLRGKTGFKTGIEKLFRLERYTESLLYF